MSDFNSTLDTVLNPFRTFLHLANREEILQICAFAGLAILACFPWYTVGDKEAYLGVEFLWGFLTLATALGGIAVVIGRVADVLNLSEEKLARIPLWLAAGAGVSVLLFMLTAEPKEGAFLQEMRAIGVGATMWPWITALMAGIAGLAAWQDLVNWARGGKRIPVIPIEPEVAAEGG